MSDAATVEPSFDVGSELRGTPADLLAAVLERVPLPVVMDRGPEGVILNAAARRLWPAMDGRSPAVPATAGGETESLLERLACAATDQTLLRAPDGNDYCVDTFGWPSIDPPRRPAGAYSPACASACACSHADRHTDRLRADRPGKEAYESCRPAGTARVAVLRPPDGFPPDGALLHDKVVRLKAIVHELRNALTAAREALAILQEGVVGELNREQRRFLDSAMEDLEHLVRAMVDLTQLWVTQAGVLRILLRPVDLGHAIEQTTLSVRSAAEKAGLSLYVEVADPPPILIGDCELLVQALRNVLTNAVQHTPAGGEIRVRAFCSSPKALAPAQTRASDDDVIIDVGDSGTGIAPGDRERVFQPFQQGRTSRSGQPPTPAPRHGMGLGLTIARDIAWIHGGTLEIQKVTDAGTSNAGLNEPPAAADPGRTGRQRPLAGTRFAFRFPRSQSCTRSWMVRVAQRAMDDVRPLRVPLAAVLFQFEPNPAGAPCFASAMGGGRTHPDRDNPSPTLFQRKGWGTPAADGRNHDDLLSAIQQLAVKNLRPADTVLAIEDRLLLLMRGAARAAAYTIVDRVLGSLVEMSQAGRGSPLFKGGGAAGPVRPCRAPIIEPPTSKASRVRSADHWGKTESCGCGPPSGPNALPEGRRASADSVRWWCRFGVAVYPEDGPGAADLLARAESELGAFLNGS